MLVTACLITTDAEYPKEIEIKGFDEVLITTKSPSVYERFILASKARNDIIYVQDDDCILDYLKLFDWYDGRLTNGISEDRHCFYASTGMTLIGWGCYFPKSMLVVFEKYIAKYGVDHILLRECDRIFTYLNQPHNTHIMSRVDIRQNAGRLSCDPKHNEYLMTALERAKSVY